MTGQVLTSWKEIAAYLGKGVRTVQRWESEMGLPVRRPGPDRHIVVAFPAELDQWVRGGARTGNTLEATLPPIFPDIALTRPNGRRQNDMELKRMRVLMQEMRDRLSFNREQTARLLEQFGRRLVKDNGGQKLRQSA